MRRPLALAAALLLGACANSFEGPSQPVAVVTSGTEGASCTLSTPEASYRVTAPGAVVVQKSAHPLEIVCRKEGYQDGVATLASSYQAGSFWSSLSALVGLGAAEGRDPGNGYQDSIAIPMWRKSTVALAPAPSRPAAAPLLEPVAVSDYGVRFGAYASAAAAREGWSEIWRQYWPQLGGVEPQLMTARSADGGPRYHLYGMGLTRERAESLCFYLQQSGQSCEAVRF
jgi:hypothetical protein